MAFPMHPQLCALLIKPEVPDEVLKRGITAEHADYVIEAVRQKTSIEMSRNQVYKGVQYLRLNPDPTRPGVALVTLRDGYLNTADPVKIAEGLRGRLQYEQTHMRVTESGLVVPLRESVVRLLPQHAPMVDAMIDRYQEAERLVASVFPNNQPGSPF